MSDALALRRAFARLEAFEAVQRADHGRLTPEAVERLQEAVGIGDAERVAIRESMPAAAAESSGAVLLGVLVGLFAASDQTS